MAVKGLVWCILAVYLCGYAQATTDKPRNDKQLYEQFLQFQNYLLSQNIMTDSDSTNMGCKWRDKLHRINDTRFFIYDTIGRKDIEANFTTARAFCEALNEKGLPTGKWRLARIEHLTTFRMITRKMEEVAKGASQHNNEGYKDSFFWIDAFFNYDTNTFQDSDGNILKFNSVLLYRHYKPMGIGAHEKHDDKVYNITKDKPNFQQCLTLSLPWPNEAEKGNYKGMTFGHQASFEERACEATQKFKPICENLQPECRYSEDLRNFNYFPIEGYAQKSYVDDGVWVFANRRFLVNLTPRNKTESEKFCESIKTKLYTPRTDDTCLIAYLKLWNIHLTHLHFWTTIKAKYTGLGTKDKAKEKDYQSRMSYENGTDFTLHRRNKVAADKLTLSDTARVDWIEQNATLMKIFDNLCVTANWAYEYPNETAWNTDENGTAVNWNFLTFAYASCDLYVGTICEPTDLKHEPKCNWRKGWTANYELAINYTAVTEFGFNGSGLYRSTYKQQFGQHICQIPILQNIKDGVDYEISLDTLDYHAITEKKLREEVMHYYDYLEPYWVVDHTREENDWFQNATKDVEECLVSQAVKINTTSDDQIAFRREVKKVNCLEWHFYLCGPEEFDSWAHDEL